MGNCESANAEAQKRNRVINQEIEGDRKKSEHIIKLLLLGAGESGKSTILKQLKIIHDNGYSSEEFEQKKVLVYANVVLSMGAILQGVVMLKIPLASLQLESYAAKILKMTAGRNEAAIVALDEETYQAIKALWNDKGVQLAYARKDEFYVNDSAKYFLDSLDRIYAGDYQPNEQDVLQIRIPTMGVIEVNFTIKSKLWRVFDVGGQRSQRKKWIHCFDDATAVIFVVALSEFDQLLLEDNNTNRMRESLQLFRQVCNNRYFQETSMILFLNKKDLFAQKIGRGRSLKIAFPDYTGQDTYEYASRYIEKRFVQENEVPNKTIYVHMTCATDTTQVQFVLDSVLDTILSTKLKGCGLY